MFKCLQCGHEIDIGGWFCPNCDDPRKPQTQTEQEEAMGETLLDHECDSEMLEEARAQDD